jgi:type IV fimbrial biogenesis protein FimT
MLKASASERGFNLIEILVTLTVLGVLIALGAPSLAEFLQNQQIRAAAEAMVNGMQVARGEAVKRNLAVQVVIEVPDSQYTSGWTICDATLDPCDSTAIAADEALPADQRKIFQHRSPEEGTSVARTIPVAQDLVTPAIAVTFSPLGGVVPNFNGSATLTRVDVIRGSDPNQCMANGGSMRCLRVVVSGGGSIRMCDPTPGIVAPDPRACP